MEDLKLTLIQTELFWENPDANRRHFSEKIDDIKGETDLILLPEMFTTGFSMNVKAMAESPGGPTLEWLQTKAKKTGAAISGSLIIKDDDNFYNRLYFVFPDGRFEYYDKRHLFSFADEDRFYSSGQKKLLITYKGWKICPLICYDLRFPVWARNVEDYDFLYYVANWPKPRIESWDILLKARSVENIGYTAGLNRIGSDAKANEYNGHSAVYDPLGQNLLPVENGEKAFIHTISLSKTNLVETRKRFQFLKDRDKFTIL